MARRRVLFVIGAVAVIAVAVLAGFLLGRDTESQAVGAPSTSPPSTSTSSSTTTTTAVDDPQLVPTGELLVEVDGHGAVFSGTTSGLRSGDVTARAEPAPDVPSALAVADGLHVEAPDELVGVLELRLPLPDPPSPDAVPVAVHVTDDGTPIFETGLYDPGSNELIVGASEFSSRFGGWLSPQRWWGAVKEAGSAAADVVTGGVHFISNVLTGRTKPPTCGTAPSWASHTTSELSSVHVCLQTNTSDDGVERAETFIRSNRRTAQLVQVPSGHEYLWVQNQSDVVRELLVAGAGGDRGSVLLLGGQEMSFGFRQPVVDVSYEARFFQNSVVGVLNQVGGLVGGITEGDTLATAFGVMECAIDTAATDVGGLVGCAIELLADADLAVHSFDAMLSTAGVGAVERNDLLARVRVGLDRIEPMAKRLSTALLVSTGVTNTWDAIWDNLAEGLLTVHFTGERGSGTTGGTAPRAGRCPQMAQGTWEGTWGSGAGSLHAEVSLSETVLTGRLTVTNSPYVPGGGIEGDVDCEVVRFGRVDDSVEFEGTLSPDGRTLTGTYTAWAPSGGSYPVDTGEFEVRATR